VRDGLRSFLSEQPDIKVVGEAANGLDAFQRVAELRPDVAVMDISMPELDGITATQRIHEMSPSTKVVILSMHPEIERISWALQAGARGYVLKASAGAELVKAVRMVYAGHRYLSQQVSEQVIEEYVRQSQAGDSESPLADLSSREEEVLRLVVEGKTNDQVADILSLSSKTVATYRFRMMQKLDISDLPSLVKFAIRHGLTSAE
jgi:DNA-binding NarL/FixJ family response regulator